jgi:hypothetical protein
VVVEPSGFCGIALLVGQSFAAPLEAVLVELMDILIRSFDYGFCEGNGLLQLLHCQLFVSRTSLAIERFIPTATKQIIEDNPLKTMIVPHRKRSLLGEFW